MSDGAYWAEKIEEEYEREREREEDDETSNLVYFSKKLKRGDTKMTEKTESIVEDAIKLGEKTLEEILEPNRTVEEQAEIRKKYAYELSRSIAIRQEVEREEEEKITVSPPFLANSLADHQGMMITLYGEPGVGKSTLAAALCKDKKTMLVSLESIKAYKNKNWVEPTQTPTRTGSVVNILNWLLNNNHDYKALIVDSISKLDEIISLEVLAEDPKKNESLNKAHGGWNAGVDIVQNRHRAFKKLFDRLVDKGMLIIFVAHVTENQKTIASSEEEFLYSNISLNKRYSDIYTYYVDVVAKIYPRFFVKEGRIKTADDKIRIFDCVTNAAQCSKNNLGISEAIEFGIDENPLKEYL